MQNSQQQPSSIADNTSPTATVTPSTQTYGLGLISTSAYSASISLRTKQQLSYLVGAGQRQAECTTFSPYARA